MRLFIALLLFVASSAHAINVNPACPVTSGTLTVPVVPTRTTCNSPCWVFFDATGTTDSANITANMTPFQDVFYSWNYGDTLGSGTGTWQYGARPNTNSTNKSTGAVGGHLYITEGRDTKFTVTLTAKDSGGNVAICGLGVTVVDPSNAYPGINTTCVAASSTPVAGSGGCPAGAGVLLQSNFNTALTSKFGSGKRVLFKCGDTFTGTDYSSSAVNASIDAYGACPGTQTNRPIFNTASTSTGFININGGGDLRISNINCQGGGTGGGCVNSLVAHISYQVTLYNLLSSGSSAAFTYAQGAQWAMVNVVQNRATSIGTFFNFNENNPPYSGNLFNNLDYAALMGSHIVGPGNCCASFNTGSGIEAVRISECRMCMFENNDVLDSNNTGPVFKLHNGNTHFSSPGWTGIYTEFVIVSDNWFGGFTGGGAVEAPAPQNNGDDERFRNIVVERNYFSTASVWGGISLYVAATNNETVRDNIFNLTQLGVHLYSQVGMVAGLRGPGPGLNSNFLEVYNNTIYSADSNGQTGICFCIFSDITTVAANSLIKDNIVYFPAGGSAVVTNAGAGNTVSNNSTISANPSFVNGTGNFTLPSDFKPTANFSGAVAVPNFTDALGISWPPTWDLGAVHH